MTTREGPPNQTRTEEDEQGVSILVSLFREFLRLVGGPEGRQAPTLEEFARTREEGGGVQAEPAVQARARVPEGRVELGSTGIEVSGDITPILRAAVENTFGGMSAETAREVWETELIRFGAPAPEVPEGRTVISEGEPPNRRRTVPTGERSATSIKNELLSYMTAAERRIYDRLPPRDAEAFYQTKLDALQERRNRALDAERRRQAAGDDGSFQFAEDQRFQRLRDQAASQGMTFEEWLDQLLGGAGGGGGGGGAVRTYIPPDRAQVSDSLRTLLIALTGSAEGLDQAVETYMQADRQKFDGQSVDPLTRVKELVRGTPRFQQIHRLRPQSISEEEWIFMQRNRLLQRGIPLTKVDDMAIDFAIAGVNPNEIGAEDVAVRRLADSGVATTDLTSRASQIGSSVGRLIR